LRQEQKVSARYEQPQASPDLVDWILVGSDPEQGSQPHSQLRDVAMEASHRVSEGSSSAGRLRCGPPTPDRPGIAQARLQRSFGTAAFLLQGQRQWHGTKGSASAVAMLRGLFETIFHADASFASPNNNGILAPVRRYLPVEFARRKQSRSQTHISSESLWGKPKTLLSKTGSVDKMRDSAPSQALFSLSRAINSPGLRHACYGNFLTTPALNVISVSAQSVTRNSNSSRCA
jgi:hypothetical protein